MRRSAGILPYKVVNNEIFVYLEHPGGPYWQGKDLWSICKGEYTNEKAIDAAIREFKEEANIEINKDDLFFIGSEKQEATNKLVTVFGVETDFDYSKMSSNTFTLEWPPSSGEYHEFPEMDEGRWFSIDEAEKKILKGQRKFLEKLNNIINREKT